MRELDAEGEARERRGEEPRRRAVRLVTSPRPSPHAREIHYSKQYRDTQAGSHRAALEKTHTGGLTKRRGYTTSGLTRAPNTGGLTKRHWKETHYIERHTGGLTRKPQAHADTHTQGFTRTHIHRQTSPFTPLGPLKSRFLREKEAASWRAGVTATPCPAPEFSQTLRALLKDEGEQGR